MAYVDLNSVQNPSAGATILSAWGDQVRDNLEALRKPKLAYVDSGVVGITDGGSPHAVTFVNETHDTASMFTPGNSYVSIPESGFYAVIATVEWDAWTGGRRFIEIDRGGSSLGHVTGPAGPNGDCAQEIVLPVRGYTSGDHVGVNLFQDSGVTVSCLCSLSVVMVGVI